MTKENFDVLMELLESEGESFWGQQMGSAGEISTTLIIVEPQRLR